MRALGSREWEKDDTLLGAGFLGELWGDVVHLARRALADINSWRVKLETQAGKMVLAIKVQIGNDLHHVIASTIEEAGDLVETIFASIAKMAEDVVALVKEVVAFLAMLFDWSDIVRTHMVFRHLVNWSFSAAVVRIDEIKTYATTSVTSLKTKLDTQIALAKKHLKDETANSQAPGGAATLKGDSVNAHFHHHASRCHYVSNASRSKMQTSQMVTKTGQTPSRMDKTTAAMAKTWNAPDNGQASSKSFTSSFKAKNIDITDICGTSLSVLLDVLQTATDAMLSGLEDVVEALLDLISTCLDDAKKIINYTIEIPIITWLWKHVITDGTADLSILDLLCMISAVPATILYKILKGTTAGPFSSDDVANIGKLFLEKTGKIDFKFVATSSAAALEAAAGTPFYKTLDPALGIVCGITTLFGAAFSAVGDYWMLQEADAENADNATVIGWLSWGTSLISTLVAVPVDTFANYSDGLPASVAQTIYYGTVLFLSFVDVGLIVATGNSFKLEPVIGPVGDGFYGIAIVAAAVLYIIEDALANGPGDGHVWNWLNAVLSNFQRPLRLSAVPVMIDVEPLSRETAYATAVTLVCGGDAVAGIGGAVTAIVPNL